MSELFQVAAGWTGILGPFTLKLDGVPFNLTGFEVRIKLTNAAGEVTPGGTVNTLDQGTLPGQVTYSPVETDFIFLPTGNRTRQVYLIRWEVEDVTGKIVFFPNGEADEIGVYR